MANSNNIFTRFINYFAVLILFFLSSQIFAAGGSFGGGGAGGSWGDECATQYKVGGGNNSIVDSPNQACVAYFGSHATISSVEVVGDAVICKASYPGNPTVYPPTNVASVIRKCQECPVGYESVNGKCSQKNVLLDKR